MSSPRPAPTTTRRIRRRRISVAGLLVVVAAILATLGGHELASPPPASSAPTAPAPIGVPHAAADGVAGGAIRGRTSVFDDDLPGVANLDPALLRALREAASDAAVDGVALLVDSGWRSAAYQERLRREAVAKYGSDAEAARWVATARTSAHVSGDAVDVGPSGAAAWLAGNGVRYGLCQTYGNEPWHFELRPDAVDHGCPPAYPDPTHDPRMQS